MCQKPDFTNIAHCLPMIDAAATGRNILRLRRAAGLTVRDLQELFGFATPQAIYKWQKGDALPTLEHAAVLSRLLNVRIEELLVWKTFV